MTLEMHLTNKAEFSGTTFVVPRDTSVRPDIDTVLRVAVAVTMIIRLVLIPVGVVHVVFTSCCLVPVKLRFAV